MDRKLILLKYRLKSVDTNGLLCLSSEPHAVPESFLWAFNAVIGDGCVTCNTIVPEADRPFLPLNANLEILTLVDVL